MSSQTTRIAFCVLVIMSSLIGCSKKQNSPTSPSTSVPNEATIDLKSPQQLIRGFGGVNIPGWIADLTPAQVNEAFGTGDGQIGLSILRIRVSYDETQFFLEVPTARLAASLGATIIASPWTPPATMKSSNSIIGGILSHGWYFDYATHLKTFADFMAANGAPLYAISVQNEPDASVNYESCSWSATQLLDFVRTAAPAIGVKIIVPESENFDHSLSDPILNDTAAAANVSIIGGHIYGGGLTSYPLAVNMGKEVWMTEHLLNNTDWAGAFGTAQEINDCMNAGMSAYLWWYIRRSYGPIDENSNVTKRGYVMSQFSRFVRPGFSRVISTVNPQRNVSVTAYAGNSKIVIVVLNNGSSVTQPFAIPGATLTKVTPYITSGTKNCFQGGDIAVSNGSFSAALDSSSVTTFVSN
jgi:glucuronoarabinoxylan endo-1,4-beta-xylanase